MQREKVSWDGIKDRVEQTIKVAHVTFYLVREDEDSYLIFSESPRESLDLMRDPRFPEDIDERFFYGAVSYNDALIILQEAIVSLEGRLERKRDGMPTPRQLAYLFRHKIPIPLTLTWGQASDIIDEKIAQIAKEKQDKVQAKRDQFHGF